MSEPNKASFVDPGTVVRDETPQEKPHVLTVDEARRILRIGRMQAYEAVKRGDIPSIRLGGKIVIPRAAFEEKFGVTV